VLFSLSIIVTTPAPSKIDAFVGSESVMLIVSDVSITASSITGTVKVLVVWFALKVRTPVLDV
jgi:hypothetical protein